MRNHQNLIGSGQRTDQESGFRAIRRAVQSRGANPVNKVMQFLTDLKSYGWKLMEFEKSLLLGARRNRATQQLPWKREVRRKPT